MTVFSLEPQPPENPTVCIIDASSYTGFWVLKGLLSRGYAVHAAIQNQGKNEIAMKVREMEKAERRLAVFEVDVLDYHSIAEAMKGCSALFCSLDSPIAYDELAVEMEVRGAINVVEACAHTETVGKLVFSSSLTAGVWREDVRSLRDVDERCWSDSDYCRKLKLWHALAKTLSEQAAWALAMDRMLNMVAVNSGLVLGPSVAELNPIPTMSYLKGAAQMHENGVLATVDAKLLADAHIRALEDESAAGRYFCFDRIVNNEEGARKLADSLRPLISISPTPRCGSEESSVFTGRLRDKKLKELVDRAPQSVV